MGLLEQQNDSLLPVTANPKMLAQALKARQQPRTQLTGQGLLDTAAIGLSPVPIVGDALGLAADASRFYNEPESRTPLNFGLAALGLIPFVPPLVSAGLGKFAQSQGKTLAQAPTGPARNQAGAIVYHGSPHKFDQFDSSKIGTGEGAQAYGHGLYFAENPSVAQSYAGKAATQIAEKPDGTYRAMVLDNTGKPSAAQNFKDRKSAEEFAKAEQAKFGDGAFYKVDLPDEAIAKMLDWDLPLSKQPQIVQDWAKTADLSKVKDGNRTKVLLEKWRSGQEQPEYPALGHTLYNALSDYGSASRPDISAMLKNAGIPGVKYFDGGSRGAGEGTRNFVVFPGNEGLLKILERQ